MGFLIKVIAAVSLWSNADHRRSEVLSECTFYGIGMTMIGTVITLLVATGTFPASHEAMMASGMLAVYLDKYIMYTISGVCVYWAAKLARSSLRNGATTTVAKLVLVFGAVCLLVSIALTIVAFVKYETAPALQQTPAWVTAIHVLLLVVRLLFLSVLVMALYTLVEADRSHEIAHSVAGHAPTLPVIAVPVLMTDQGSQLPLNTTVKSAQYASFARDTNASLSDQGANGAAPHCVLAHTPAQRAHAAPGITFASESSSATGGPTRPYQYPPQPSSITTPPSTTCTAGAGVSTVL